MKYYILFLCSIMLLACNDSNTVDQPPNVLFILADDLGYHDLSCMGSTFYETPNIDRIAEEGTIFREGYACSRVCSPSRASIMSGKFTARHGITDWIGAKTGEEWSALNRQTQLLPPEYLHNLEQGDVVLPEALQEAGYTTFFAGKWHLGSEGAHPEDHGFDINKGGWDVGSPKGGYFSPYVNPKLKNQEDGEYLPHRLAKETTSFIENHKDQAFFAFLSFYAVHGPLQTTKEKWNKYQQKAVAKGVLESGYKMERRLPVRQLQDNPVYAGLIEGMDEAVGMVLKTLEELGLEENTIVIFTSDNGGVASGDDYATSNLPLRGGKGYQWEGGIRAPFFIKVPWMKNRMKDSDTPVTGADFYPTILDLLDLDLKPDEHVDGLSLLPILKGERIAERPLFWHYPHYGNQGGDPSSIIREGKWKLIHYWEDGTNELYDLEKDLEEIENLANKYPEKVTQLWQKLDAWLNSVKAKKPEVDPRYQEELERERLDKIAREWLPRFEKQRMDLLSPDYQPNEDWWGSGKE